MSRQQKSASRTLRLGTFGLQADLSQRDKREQPLNDSARCCWNTIHRCTALGHLYTQAREHLRLPPTESDASFDDAEEHEEDIWLTRTLAMDLQRDFGALYDYLVNRDVAWDVSEARAGRKWVMALKSIGDDAYDGEYPDTPEAFDTDSPDLPLTEMLVDFDSKQRFPHIPHPYPLVPESIAPVWSPPPQPSARNPRSPPPNAAPRIGVATERRVHLAYTESTNIYALGGDKPTGSNLPSAFTRFEKSDRVGAVDPATARLGRWVLLYGILQTLASVAVDSPSARCRRRRDVSSLPETARGEDAAVERGGRELAWWFRLGMRCRTAGLCPGEWEARMRKGGGRE